MNTIVDFLKYPIRHFRYLKSVRNIESVKEKIKVVVANSSETIDIINQGFSISRFGDGELSLVMKFLYGTEFHSNFQKYDEGLARRLRSILSYKEPIAKHIVGIPACAFNVETRQFKKNIAWYWNQYMYLNADKLTALVDKDNHYADTNFTRFYMDYKRSDHCKKYVEKLKTIWNGRNILIVEGEQTRLGVGNSLFSSAQSVRRVLCPSLDAYSQYDKILETVLNAAKDNDLILVALGMTATVLSYDLAAAGFQTLDVGHIDIEYEWYLMGAKDKVAIKSKFTNESEDGHHPSFCTDHTYLNSIVAKVL